MRFIDTNVLIYAVSPAPVDRAKSERALLALRSSQCALSVQVLQEFYVQSTRQIRVMALTHDEAMSFIVALSRFPVQENTLTVFHAAIQLSKRYQISYWDGAIIAAAQALGCDELLSEDLNVGQDYDGVKVVNPFA